MTASNYEFHHVNSETGRSHTNFALQISIAVRDSILLYIMVWLVTLASDSALKADSRFLSFTYVSL